LGKPTRAPLHRILSCGTPPPFRFDSFDRISAAVFSRSLLELPRRETFFPVLQSLKAQRLSSGGGLRGYSPSLIPEQLLLLFPLSDPPVSPAGIRVRTLFHYSGLFWKSSFPLYESRPFFSPCHPSMRESMRISTPSRQ